MIPFARWRESELQDFCTSRANQMSLPVASTGCEPMAITELGRQLIEAKVKAFSDLEGLDDQSRAFALLMLSHLIPRHVQELREVLTDGPLDRGVDALYIDEDGASATITLFQFKYHQSPTKLRSAVPESECHKACSFISELLECSDSLLNTTSLVIQEKVKAIWGLIKKGVVCHFRFVFVTNGTGLTVNGRQILSSLGTKWSFSYDELSHHEVASLLAAKTREKSKGQIQVVGRDVFDRSDGDIRGLVASVDAKSYIELITGEGGAFVQRHLFDDNIRIYLGPSGGYNSDIIRSAVAPENYLFWYLNNGITIVCDRFSYNKGTPSPLINLDGFQIVNGGQTSFALYEVYKTNAEKLDGVSVLVRVYETVRADIANKVAVATNSQARIQKRDLRANDEIQKKYEAIFLEHGFYYERKKSQHSDRVSNKRLDAFRLGQIILSFYFGEPDLARTASDEIFGDRYAEIFTERRNFKELAAVVAMNNAIEDRRSAFLDKRKAAGDGDKDKYLVYGQWFVLFAASMICQRDKVDLTSVANVDEIVREALEIVASVGTQRASISQYNLFRSSRTRSRIEEHFKEVQLSLFDLMAA